MMALREKILRKLYQAFPFDLHGDCLDFAHRDSKIDISCVINFYGRLDLLAGILFSLAAQDYPKDRFEVILIEDKGGTEEGKIFCESFTDRLPIVYVPLDNNYGKMGYSRNFGLARARGRHVLFLDDDTVILQHNFLTALNKAFTEHPDAEAITPRGEASFALIKGRYSYHDAYFMTSRCMAYRRETLQELGGFRNPIIGQEDVEFVVRFHMAGKRAIRAPHLTYYHPPLLVPNFRKPRAVGQSFFRLRSRYPLLVWLLLLLNCSRHAFCILIPVSLYRQQGRFGCGFLAGVIQGISGKTDASYG